MGGENDPKVRAKNLRNFSLTLSGMGRDVSLMISPDEGHNLKDALARKAYFYLLETFLAQHLGGQHVKRDDPALSRYIHNNMEFVGTSQKPLLHWQRFSPYASL